MHAVSGAPGPEARGAGAHVPWLALRPRAAARDGRVTVMRVRRGAVQERYKAKQAEVRARDDAVQELQARFQRQLAAKDRLLQQREVEVAELAEKEGQLRAAQARLAQVAPLMRRIAAHGGAPGKYGT